MTDGPHAWRVAQAQIEKRGGLVIAMSGLLSAIVLLAENANIVSGVLGYLAGALIGGLVVAMATMRTVPVIITASLALVGAAFFAIVTYIDTAVQGQDMFGIAPMVALATIFGAFAGAIAGAIVSLIVEGFSRKRR